MIGTVAEGVNVNCGLCRDCKWWDEVNKDQGDGHYAECTNPEWKVSCEDGAFLHQTAEDFGCVQFEVKA